VAGLDEVGRGTLAGPVAAAAVILPHNPQGYWVGLVRDSKQMTPAQREEALAYLQAVSQGMEVGYASSTEIDEIGIVGATRLAMKRAVDGLALRPQFLLVDALSLPEVPIPQRAIVHGDATCLSIAAASIVAKVTRDRLMEREDAAYPGYGFAQHKGYGTSMHLNSLRRLGPSPIHRYSFGPVKALAAGR
jgi:ribonuclease HII